MNFDPTRKLDEEAVKATVREVLGHGGGFTYTKHARERMIERNFTFRDVVHIIEHGTLKDSEYNELATNWKYKFEGTDLEGCKGVAVIAITIHKNCVLITLF